MAQARAVPVDTLPPGFDQVAFIALPLVTLKALSDAGAQRGMTVPQLLVAALDAFLRQPAGPQLLTETKE
jgi:hypothetical protein